MSGTVQDRVDIPTAAARLGLSVDTVRKRIQRGTLPAEKHEGRWVVLLDTVQDGVWDSPGRASVHVQDVVLDDPQDASWTMLSGLSEFVAMLREKEELVKEKDRTILELAGRVGFLQAEVLQLREQVKQLTAPAESHTSHSTIAHNPASETGPTDQVYVETAQDTATHTNGHHSASERPPRPWWKRLVGWVAQPG